MPRRPLLLETFEDRILCSATAPLDPAPVERPADAVADFAVAADAQQAPATPAAPDGGSADQPASAQSAAPSAEIVFVDKSVTSYQALLAGLNPGAEVVLLESNQDGLQQMAQALAGRTGIDAIHVIAHGSVASLNVGNTTLTTENMQGQYASLLQTIGQSLSADGDLLIYGCNFGQGADGLLASQTLAQLTGADVASSTNNTGSASMGGDWILENHAGAIEAGVVVGAVAQAQWSGLLAPPPLQYFYLPYPEDAARTVMATLQATAGNDVHSITSISISESNTIIYYDHWEGSGTDIGFETNLSNPTQASTQIWGDGNAANGATPGAAPGTDPALVAGQVITLENDVPANPRVAANFYFDGGDKIGASKTISVARVNWSTNLGAVSAEGSEVYDTRYFGTSFTAPVGENTEAAIQIFELSSFFVMASQDNTVINIDHNADGDFLDAGDVSGLVLNEGGSYATPAATVLNAGARVTSSKPVQVHLVTGDIGPNFESRNFALLPNATLGNDYYSPVGTTSATVFSLFIHNPNAAAITVNIANSAGTTAQVIAANTTFRSDVPFPAGIATATRLFSAGGEQFSVVGAMDVPAAAGSGQIKDWGFSIKPTSFMSSVALTAYAPGYLPGSPPATLNASPLWVTVGPDKQGDATTRVFVDWNGDLVADTFQDLAPLQIGIFQDTADPLKDQTGARVYTTDGTLLTTVWGQNPAVVPDNSAAFLDAGYAVPPIPLPEFFKFATFAPGGDLNGDGFFNSGDRLTYTLQVRNIGVQPITNAIISDALPAQVTYVNGTTTIDQGGGPVAVADDTIPAADTRFPLDITANPLDDGLLVVNMAVGNTTTITFDVTINGGLPTGITSVFNAGNLAYEIYNVPASDNSAIRGTVTGTAFDDRNNDGDQDAGESGIAGVTMTLTGTDIRGVAVSKTTTTDASGNYLFADLRESDGAGYTVTQTQPVGYLDGLEARGGTVIPGSDGGPNVITGIVVIPGENDANNNFADLLPSITIDDVTRNEADGTMTFTVSLNAASGLPVSVNYATSNGTAVAGTDYTAVSGTLNFAAGVTTQPITVTILNDAIFENSEAFNMNLSGAVNATIADALGIGTITDNDTPTLVVTDVTATEGTDAYAVFSVSLSNLSSTPVSFNLALANVSATGGGTDYGTAGAGNLQVSTDGGLTWADAASATIPALNTSVLVRTPVSTDGLAEPTETFTLTATRTAGTTTNASATGIGTILNNQPPVAVDNAYTTNEDTTLTVAWWDTNWTRRQQITFSGNTFPGAENLTNFPVLLKLNSGNIDYTQTQDNGEDLRFFDPDGNLLAYEIETWNETGDSYVWVKVPQVNTSGTDSIEMYYGNAAATAGQDPTAVWAGSNYTGVFHLNDAAGTINDSTINNYDGTNSGTVAGPGQIGGARDFESGSGTFIDVGRHRNFASNSSTVTLSAWVNRESASGLGESILSTSITNGGTATASSRASLQLLNDNLQAIVRSDDGAVAVIITTTTNPLAGLNGSWHNVAMVVDVAADTIEFYVDGNLINPATYSGTPTFAGSAFFASPASQTTMGANEGGGNELYDGLLDEARFANTGRSAAWMKADYLTMTNSFVTIGAAQMPPVLGGIMGNDSDPEGQQVRGATLVSGTTNGSVMLNPDGTFVYTPNLNYTGTDSFTYTVNDGVYVSNVATVTITILPQNDDFTDNNEVLGTFKDTPLSGNVIDGTSPDGPITVTQFTVAGDATVYTAGQTATITGVGTLAIGNNGSFTFTPLATFYGPVPVATYTMTDGSGANDTSTLTITVVTPLLDQTFKDGSVSADDTSVTSSTGANVVVGEQVAYDIFVTLPEGVTQSLNVIDAVPAGLRVDGFQILTTTAAAPLLAGDFNGSFTTSPATSVFTGPGNLTLNFGNTTVVSDNVTTNNSFVIRVQATVLNIGTNQGAVTRSNTATLTYTNPITALTATVDDSNSANDPVVTVVEPSVVTTKTVSVATPDSGDPISYTITLNNTSGQTAYDVSLTDVLPAELTGASITSVTATGTVFINGVAGTPVANTDVIISGGTLQFAGGSNIDLATGSSITITVSGTVAGTATPNQTVTNTALTSWTSTDGGNADERTGADGVGGALNDYASSNAVTFTVPQGVFAKQLVSTSAVSTTGSNVTIGETATYALIVTLPEGTTPGLSVIDVLPPGLQYVSSSVVTTAAASSGLLAADFGGTVPAPVITGGAGNGDDVTFTFGSISVTGDNNAANNRFLILITAQVLDVGTNAGVNPPGQTVLPNAGNFDITGDGLAAFTTPAVNLTVVEPRMVVTKSMNPAGADAGDTITVTLTVQNTGTSDAFDVTVDDPFPAGKFTGFTAVTTPPGFTFGTSGDTVTFTDGTITAGSTATFTFTAVLTSSVTPTEVLNNIASLTQATTLPGAVAGERNITAASPAANTTVPAATLAKTLFATSEASTAGSDVTIGETLTYALTVTLPEGTTPNLTLVDLLPAGMQYVSHSLVTTAAASGGLLAADFDGTVGVPVRSGTTGDGDDQTFTFGSISVTGDNATNNNRFLVLVTAQVLDVGTNVGVNPPGQTVLANSATLDIVGDSAGVITSGPINVTVVEPRMTITKNIDLASADAGDTVTITLVVDNTGTSNAYDVTVNDPFPAGKFTGFTAGTTPATFTFGTSGDTVTFTGGTINAGTSATFIFTAVLSSAVAPGEVLNNIASVTQATTLPGTVTGERTASVANGSDSVAVPIGSYEKSLFSTSDASTATDNVGIGETITYALKVTLPEGTTSDLSVVDLLPAGLQYLSHSLFTTAAGSGGLLAADFAGTITGPVRSGTTGDGDDQTFAFSTINVTNDNTANNNSFLLLVTAQVTDAAGNVGLSGSQTTLNNQATFDIPTDGSPLVTTPNVPATVVEPRLQITKAASDTTPDPGQTLTYTLDISHTASSTGIAYDVLLRDAIPAGITLNTGSILVNGVAVGSSPLVDANTSTGSLLDLKFNELVVGGTITVSYTATLSTNPSLAGTNLENNAKIYWDTDAAEDTNTVLSGGSDGSPDRDLGALAGLEAFNVNTDPSQDTERVTVNASTISGTVYHDANADGTFNGADTGIVGVTVALNGTDLNGNLISRTTSTIAGGAYSFTGLTAGVYTITETQPATYTDAVETVGTNFGGTISAALGSDTITGVTIPVQTSATGAGYNFGDVLSSSIAGSVFSDVNNDGIRQGGETGISGTSVRLTGTDVFGQAVLLNGSTDGSGNYTFDNGGVGLRPGTYVVIELAQPAGFLDGRDTAGTSGGNATAVNEQISAIVLAQNTAATGYVFGELNPSSLAGSVYQDLDNDGVRDAGENGIQGVTITLTGTDDLLNPVSTTGTTDATGAYSFMNLRPGTYQIAETQPAGYTTGINTIGTGLSAPNAAGSVSGDNLQAISIVNVAAGNNAGAAYNFGEIFAPQLGKTVGGTSQTFTVGNTVALGETVRYRITTEIPQSTFTDLVITDLLPAGMTYVNDGTASYAFVATNAGAITSTLTPNAPAVSTAGAAFVAGNETTVATVTPSALLGAASISSDLANTTQTYASGGSVYFHLGTISNFDGDANREFVVIEFNARVGNETANQAGTTLGNGVRLTFDTNNDGSTTVTDTPGATLTPVAGPQVTVAEPNLTITKTVPALPNPVDAGDTITYTITVTNNADAIFGAANAADAFDVRVQDILDAIRAGNPTVELTLATPATDATIVAPGYATTTNSSTSTTVDFTISRLNVGDSVTITVNALVKADAPAGATITNTATASYTGLPGVDANERTGADVPAPTDNTPPSGGLLNNYGVGASAANKTVATPTITKTLDSTSEVATAGNNVGIGETVTYALNITLPEGVTQNVSVIDALPAGLQFVSATTDFSGSGVTPFILPAETTVGDATTGTNVTWTLSDVANPPDGNAANNTFRILVTARVADLAGNTAGTTRTNAASLTYTDGTSGPATVSTNPASDPVVTVVEPRLTLAKAVDDATPDINQTLGYTLTITNPAVANAAAAFDIFVRDIIPTGLTLDTASIRINGVGIATSPLVQGGTANSTASLLDLQLTTLAVGGTITITYDATVNNALANTGTTQDNNARIYWDNLVANDGNNTVLSGTPNPSDERDYGATPLYTEAPTPGVDDPAQDTLRVVVNTNAITGTVYGDNDTNGQFGAGDTGIGSVSLRLTGTTTSGLTVDVTTTTALDGSYSFGNLPPGTYLITQTQPAGYVDALETAGTLTTTFGGTVSPALGSNTISAIVIPAQSNVTEGSYNFGETLTSSLAGNIYLDDDNDGVRDVTETGVANIPVTLTGTDIYGQAVTLGGTTNGSGVYSFTGLRPGTYTITEDDSTVVPAPYLDGRDTPGTAGGVLAGTAPKYDGISGIVLNQNTAATGYNFGELRPASLAGSVFIDADGDATRDVGETGISGVTVTLTGTDDLGNPVSTIATTGAGGLFSFTTLRPGTYTITETQPATYGDGGDAAGTLGGTVGNDVVSGIAVAAGQDGTGYSFGERLAGIAGTVFVDADRGGTLDVGETGLGGVTLTLLDNTNAPIATTTTAPDGTYTFAGLTAGNYTVVQTQPTGYGSSTLNSVLVTVPAGGSTTANFGETTALFAGQVYFDADNSNTLTPGDTNLSGVIVTLTGTDANSVAVSRTTTTAADGTYSFSGLLSGTYTITESQPAAYTDGADTVGTAGGTLTAPDSISAIALPEGVDATGYNFGETVTLPPGTGGITGTVFYDRNADTGINAGEPGLAGVTLTLRDALGNLLTTTTTAADGSYVFTGLAPGDYRVVQTQPPTYGSSTPNTIIPITVTAGAVTANQNFGETSGSFAGSVYFDANNNGVRDGGEQGIGGVTVTITGTDYASTPVSRTTITDANGDYVFAELLGGTYVVTETQPAGIADGLDAVGTSGGTLGNDTVTNIGLGGGVNATGYNFGERTTGVSGTVFVDADRGGTLNGSETGLAGVTVTLLNSLGVSVGTATTAADGSYSFLGLAPGSYTVVETQPVGYGSSTTNSVAVTVPAAGLAGVDFGETTASLAGRVYVDADGSNTFSPGDSGLGGAIVTLTGTDANGAAVSRTATTAADGSYSIDGLLAGSYQVNETQPAGYTDGADTLGSAGGVNSANDEFSSIGLGAGVQATGYEFGETVSTPPGTGSIGGTVFVDRNQDAALGGGEPGLSGVTVELRDNTNTLISTLVTGADGGYLFTNVTPGAGYQIVQTQPNGYGSSTLNTLGGLTVTSGALNGGNNFGETLGSLAGNVFLDRDASGALGAGDTGLGGVTVTLTGTDVNSVAVSRTTTTAADGSYRFDDLLAGTYALAETQPAAYSDGAETVGSPGGSAAVNDTIGAIVLPAGQNGAGHNFAELAAQLSGTVFVDADENGALTGGESGLGGVTLQLLDAGNNVVGTVTTAPDGSYTFSNLPAGNYTVAQTQPNGYGSSTSNSVAAIVPVGGLTGVNFGETTGSIAGTVYHDINNDGSIGPTEPRIANATITLSGTDVNGTPVTSTVFSDPSGNYQFTGLLAGTYTLTETQPAGYQDGLETVGNSGGNLAINDVISAIGVGAGSDVAGYLFGERTLPDLVVTKDDGKTTVRPGEDITYTITLSNQGLQDASGVVVSDQFPVNDLEFVSASAGGVFDATAGTITWNLGDITGSGAEVVTLTITARVKVPVRAGAESVDNIVTVTDDGVNGPDANPGNNTATDTDAVQAAPDLYVLKTDNLATAKVGQQITYTITGGNAGDQVADGVIITDTLPPGLRFVSASLGGRLVNGQVVWNLGALGPGATFQLTVSVVVEAAASGTNAINTVTIADRYGPFEDPTPENNAATDPTQIEVHNVFAFDSFNNFARNDRPAGPDFRVSSPHVTRDALLSLAPIYSGEADPGSTLVVTLYNARGENIGAQTVTVDAGGNWMATFPSTTVRDIPNSVRISQLSASYSLRDTHGHNLRTYFSPALNQGHFFMANVSKSLDSEPAPLLSGLGLENPLQLGTVKYGGELISTQATASGY